MCKRPRPEMMHEAIAGARQRPAVTMVFVIEKNEVLSPGTIDAFLDGIRNAKIRWRPDHLDPDPGRRRDPGQVFHRAVQRADIVLLPFFWSMWYESLTARRGRRTLDATEASFAGADHSQAA